MNNETTAVTSPTEMNNAQRHNVPSIEQWLKEAKQQPDADQCGMYLFHNGVVRGTAKAQVRHGESSPRVTGMQFSFDRKKVDAAVQRIKKMPGIFHVRAWLNSGTMQVGDDLMLLLVGGDNNPFPCWPRTSPASLRSRREENAASGTAAPTPSPAP